MGNYFAENYCVILEWFGSRMGSELENIQGEYTIIRSEISLKVETDGGLSTKVHAAFT